LWKKCIITPELVSKLKSPDFVEFITAYDIICLVETKLDQYDEVDILEGFKLLFSLLPLILTTRFSFSLLSLQGLSTEFSHFVLDTVTDERSLLKTHSLPPLLLTITVKNFLFLIYYLAN
jgi:hypothetical protein